MIRDLTTLLEPRHARALRIYLGWLFVFSLLQGAAMVVLVPTLQALLAAHFDRTLFWLLVLAALVAVTCIAHYQQAMKGFALALVVLTTLHDRLGDHVARLPLGWFSSEKIGRLSKSATAGTVMVTNVFAHLLSPVVSSILTPATIAVAMLFFDWRLGLTAILSMPLIYLTHRWSSAWVARTEEQVDAAGVRASNRVIEFARNQEVMRAFGRTTVGYEPLEKAIDDQRIAGGSMLRRTFPRLLASGLSVQLAFTALIGVGVLLGAALVIGSGLYVFVRERTAR